MTGEQWLGVACLVIAAIPLGILIWTLAGD